MNISINRNIWNVLKIICLLYFLFSVVGCGNVQGEFAFRKDIDDRFKRINGIPEFNSDIPVDWCFVFKKEYSGRTVAIVLMKKEVIWIDINSRIVKIQHDTKNVCGRFHNLNKGKYKLIITENNELADEKEFLIYNDDELE